MQLLCRRKQNQTRWFDDYVRYNFVSGETASFKSHA